VLELHSHRSSLRPVLPSEAFSCLAVDERLAQKSGPAEGATSKEEVEKEVWSNAMQVWYFGKCSGKSSAQHLSWFITLPVGVWVEVFVVPLHVLNGPDIKGHPAAHASHLARDHQGDQLQELGLVDEAALVHWAGRTGRGEGQKRKVSRF